MAITLHFENASGDAAIPDEEDVHRWASLALSNRHPDAELCIRVVSADESAALNGQYRNRNTPTNVLSFPSDLPADIPSNLIGDLAICADVVGREARDQGKSLQAHWAHMVIHGCLHLLGYDHQTDQEAEAMESLEIALLDQLGVNDPYVRTENNPPSTEIHTG
ncbi:MAG: rRNA maturation RNase YbeY [bacterium]